MAEIIEHWAHNHSGSFVAIVALILISVVQIVPIKINPWSWISKNISKLFNAEVLKELNIMDTKIEETKEQLEKHIRVDDDRNADAHRARILAFNNELIRNLKHTREDFIDILAEIDFYEHYCEAHEDYENNRAVHAIMNIKRVYDERMEKKDFEA